MSSLLSDDALKEGTVLAGATVIKCAIAGVFLMAIITAIVFQQKGLVASGRGFETTLLNFFMAPANAIKNILSGIVNLIWTTIQGIGNGIVNGAKNVGSGVTKFFHG